MVSMLAGSHLNQREGQRRANPTMVSRLAPQPA
jgi:hypothetical protein